MKDDHFLFFIPSLSFILVAACQSNPCLNGVCEKQEDEDGYVCNCEPSYSGTNCEKGISQDC